VPTAGSGHRAARSTITVNIADVLATAWKTDHSVRLVDVYYPYVLPKGSSCAKAGGFNPNKHGTTAVKATGQEDIAMMAVSQLTNK